MRRHAALLAEWAGEQRGLTDFRKHVAWYLKGFAVGSELRVALASVGSLAELDDLLAHLDGDQPYPESVLGRPPRARHRCATGCPIRKVGSPSGAAAPYRSRQNWLTQGGSSWQRPPMRRWRRSASPA